MSQPEPLPRPVQLPLIAEPDALEAVLGHPELLIVDLCHPALYRQAHVPGAIHILPRNIVSGIQPATGTLPSLDTLNQLFSNLGYQKNKHIVVYDDEGGGWAGRFIWILDVIGHKQYSYLNGGIHAWLKEGHPAQSTPNTNTPSLVNLKINDTVTASKEFILHSLDTSSIQILDARSPEEYSGQQVFAQKAGHIPGAINFNWIQGMDKSQNLRIRAHLDEEFAALGFDKNKTLVTHCQTHHRSGLTYLIAKMLEFTVMAYDGSWAEWGNSPETPVEI